jgi:hypothetical protein
MPEIDEHSVREAEQDAGSTADDLAERGDRLDDQIEETRQGWKQAQADDDVPTAAGDWEDTEPDDSTGEDPTGFDDPENLDLDEEELGDDEFAEEGEDEE